MKTFIVYLLVAGGIFISRPLFAEHDKNCKNIHGKVTVVTQDGITVDDKMYKVGESTRITKNDKVVTLENLKPGDIVCLDTRGKDDIGGGEVAGVTVLSAKDPLPAKAVKEKEYVREKETVRQAVHDKSCTRLHGKVTRVEGSTIYVDAKPYACSTTTTVMKDGETEKIGTIKTGDFVCLDAANDNVTSVTVLSPTEAAPFQSKEVIREHEKVREQK